MMTGAQTAATQPVYTPAQVEAMTVGERVIAFIQLYCYTPSGDLLGKPFLLDEFQKRFILDVYDNPYGTHRAILSIARKNGKTALIASLLLAHLTGPVARRNTQIVSGAMSRDQAAIVFDLARKMVEMNPKLRKLVHITPSGKKLTGLLKNVEYKALSAEGKTAFGLSPVLAILDEVGQVQGPRSHFISAVTTAQGAYDNALLIAISTQAASDLDLFSLWIDAQKNSPDPRVVSHVYTAPDGCELDDKKAWYAANPALGKFKSVRTMEQESKLAQTLPSNEPEFRNFSLNQRVEAIASFVSRSVWDGCSAAPGDLKGKKVWGGLDLASVDDLAALVLVDEEGGVHPTFWLPDDGLLAKAQHDLVPYDIWKRDGLLKTTPGKAIEYEYIAEYLRGVFDQCAIEKIGFDRYNMKHLRPWLNKAGFSEKEMEKFQEFGQGTQSMTPALREFEVMLLNKKLKHGGHPVLNMCARNAVVVGKSGARKFEKSRSRGRIDGMVALAMGIGVMPPPIVQREPRFFFG